jgi:hypothetical protein
MYSKAFEVSFAKYSCKSAQFINHAPSSTRYGHTLSPNETLQSVRKVVLEPMKY